MEIPFTPSPAFIDLLLDAVCVVDAQGRFVYASAACTRIFGYTPEEMAGRVMIDMVHPDDRERTLAIAAEVMAGVPRPHFENRYLRKDGSIVHIMWSARWSENDQMRVGVARDVTEQRRAESMKAVMYAISEAAHAAEDLLALYPLIHRIVGELLPAPGFSIGLYDPVHDQMHFPYHVEEHGPPSVRAVAASAALCRHVMRSESPLLVAPGAAAAIPEELRAVAARMATPWLGVPLASRHGAIGALVVRSAPDALRCAAQDIELLQFAAAQVATAIERKRLQDQLHHLARFDGLTGVPNRQMFHDRLESALARSRRRPAGFALLYLDLDGFKQVNDSYGHEAGDLLLQEVAVRVTQCVRDADTVARLGGDEFVVLLESVAQMEDAALVAGKIRGELSRPVDIGATSVLATASIGIAIHPADGDTAQRLLRRADEAMYLDKRQRAAPVDVPPSAALSI